MRVAAFRFSTGKWSLHHLGLLQQYRPISDFSLWRCASVHSRKRPKNCNWFEARRSHAIVIDTTTTDPPLMIIPILVAILSGIWWYQALFRRAVPRCIIEPTWHCHCISLLAFTVGVSNEKWFDGCERRAASFAESTRSISVRGRALI